MVARILTIALGVQSAARFRARSGEPEPSEADIRITRNLIRAGQILQSEVVDHVIVGNRNHCSLRQLGHFVWQLSGSSDGAIPRHCREIAPFYNFTEQR